MKTKKLLLFSALALLACAGLQAQVTIGGLTDPATGAILDLNSDNKGGLLLSNVSLTDVYTIPADFPGVTTVTPEVKAEFTGAMVYHTGENGIPAGIYVWNGYVWMPAGGCAACPEGSVADAECNCYTFYTFGTAGTWMTQNLRTRADLTPGSDTDANSKYYNYPNKDASSPANYGLLYTWAAATGRTGIDTNEGNIDHNPIQGICPTGWHLPSDYEWNQLEQVIAESAEGVYSSTGATNWKTSYSTTSGSGSYRGEHGQKMKSMTPINVRVANGTSNAHNNNGFDALLMGNVHHGSAGSYGVYANFWSSSSYNSSNACYRYLYYTNTGVGRYGNSLYKYVMFSVRCKKN
jgi:uncharacterized protein (TIGR02145 family)